MKLNDINIRDPFVLLYNDKYYMYGTRGQTAWGDKATGFDVYISDDLEDWSDPIEIFSTPDGFWADRNYWAPEVHMYKDRFYMFASFKNEEERRGTQILVADRPEGPFSVHSPIPVTPRDWECLDGTFYVDKAGKPHIVFCHEWVQTDDGTVCERELSDDLTKAVSEPRELFKASDGKPWIRSHQKNEESGALCYVTDGPYMYRSESGRLIMIWSSFGDQGYVQACAVSDNDDITGNFTVLPELLFEKDGGHGMLFRDKNDRLLLTLHAPNAPLEERPVFFEIEEVDGRLRVKQ